MPSCKSAFGLESMDSAQAHLPCAKAPPFIRRMKMARSGLQTMPCQEPTNNSINLSFR